MIPLAERRKGSFMSTTPVANPPSIDVAQLSAKMTELLDQFQALMPDFMAPDPARRQRVAQRARFGEQMILPMAATSDNYVPLRETNIFDADAGRLALAVRDALRPIALRLSAVTDAVSYTIDTRLAASGTEALQAYQWAKDHIKFADAHALKPYLDDASRVVKKTLNRRAKASDTPAPPAGAQTFLASRPAAPAEEIDEELDAMLEEAVTR